MRTAVSTLAVLEPRRLREALRMLRDEGPLSPIAGCTDVLVLLNFGTFPGKRFLNIWGMRELRGIRSARGRLRLGALTTYTECIRSALVRRALPMLVAASREVGGVQVQNRGTLGGNIANGSPAGDTLPVFAAADAIVELQCADDIRTVPFCEFYTGYRKSVMRPDELITAIEIPLAGLRGHEQYFRKVGTRAAQAISKVMMAGVKRLRRGMIESVRLGLGSVAPTVVRLRETERFLLGKRPDGSVVEGAKEILRREIKPIDDLRSTAEYRREVSANLLTRFLNA